MSIERASRVPLAVATAKRLIVGLWRVHRHAPDANRIMEMAAFYRGLETSCPDLLRFRWRSSKWELVRTWLERDDEAGQRCAPDPICSGGEEGEADGDPATQIVRVAARVFADDTGLAREMRVGAGVLASWLTGATIPPHDAVMRALFVIAIQTERRRASLHGSHPL